MKNEYYKQNVIHVYIIQKVTKMLEIYIETLSEMKKPTYYWQEIYRNLMKI